MKPKTLGHALRDTLKENWKWLLLVATWLTLNALYNRFFPRLLPALVIAESKFWSHHPTRVALGLTILAIVVGSLASYWKRHALKSYGIVEIIFGAALAFNILFRIAPQFDFSKMFAVGSGVYVIARGFNNLSEARKIATQL